MALSSFSTTLEDTARRICETRGGKWSGTKGMSRCPAHDDRTPSLGVTLGHRAILFHCFAGCDRASVLAAFAREGVEARMLFSGSSIAIANPMTAPMPSAAALRLWREAVPLGGSPAKIYLEGRGILAGSSALRFHPRTPLGPKGRTRFLPALIASVSLDEGPVAIHRTFLAADGAAKAAFAKPKRALGPLGEGAVRLLPPALGKLGLAEGVESAMSAYALTGIPTWATLGNERFGLVAIPEAITELHLFVDHDAAGALAAERGLTAFARTDRAIHVRRPARHGDDWNDELQAWLRRKAAS
jgi:hypothetical protein